ncbi:MAG TPA: 3-hydroxyacyl-CoA dehydrogenase NAD-binding domain-containing protein [Propionibacteriaceae bacterium]|nr:3-hydroxyacyl-CoA dehydrogenase NAD-binding domain-containing protein [Propionibacteriaceae bacterium]
MERILICGAGTMGRHVAAWCAASGYEVAVFDPKQEALDSAREWIYTTAATEGFAGTETIRYSTNIVEAARGADLVSESVPEILGRKRGLFNVLDKVCPPHTIFTTNTSLLRASKVGRRDVRPDRFAAVHFYPPLWETKLADLQPLAWTSEGTLSDIGEWLDRLQMEVIRPAKESPGYLFNTVFAARNYEAISLAANGVGTPEEIDLCWKRIARSPVGIFDGLDYVGLDTVLDITRHARRFAWLSPQWHRNVRFLKGYVDKGWLGQKTGRGFYDYS